MLQVSVPIAHELLAQCIKQGQALVQRASLVGDFSDYESWKSARKQWIDPTVQAVEHMYGGPEEARRFADAATCPESSRRWQEQYAADLKCVERALELLGDLQSELAFESAPAHVQTQAPPPAAELGSGERPEPPRQLSGEEAERALADEPPALAHEEPGERSPTGAELTRAQPIGAQLAPQQEETTAPERPPGREPATAQASQVLLAHGRDERWKQAVEHLLEQSGEHEIRIVKRSSGERARLAEEIARHEPGSRYAVVLLTADDIGGPRLESDAEPYFSTRAHQQVVFEMGFLIAALTPGRVCVLYEDGVELPCDLDGVSHVRLDLAGTWQPKLLLHLRRAGFDYDLNRLAAA